MLRLAGSVGQQPPAGWGYIPELCCLLLALLLLLLYTTGAQPVISTANAFVPRVLDAEVTNASHAAELPGYGADKYIAAGSLPALPSPPANKTAVGGNEQSADNNVAMVAGPSPIPPPRQLHIAPDGGRRLVWLWRQRAVRAAAAGDYPAADRMYSEAMELATADHQLLQELVMERSLWLQYAGRSHAADKLAPLAVAPP